MRIWNLRLNLDEFNALASVAFTDQDKAAMLGGFLLGINGGSLPERTPNGVRTAFELGSKYRKEAEGYQSTQSIAGKASADSRKAKFGSAQPKKPVLEGRSVDPRTAFDESSNLTTIHNLKTKEVPPLSPKGVVPRKRVTAPKDSDSLETVLGGKDSPTWESYWKLSSIFGPGKNPAPKSTAKLFVQLLPEFTFEQIHQKAIELSGSASEQKYLPQLLKWLEGEGYRAPTMKPLQPNRKPGIGSVSGDEYTREQIRQMPVRRLPSAVEVS